MTHRSASVSGNTNIPDAWRPSGRATLFWTVLALIILYSGSRHLDDRRSFAQGDQAYMNAGCTGAIASFDEILGAVRLVDLGGYRALAEEKRAECTPFEAAVSLEQGGDLGGAVAAYLEFVRSHRTSLLADSALHRGVSLLEQSEPETLAGEPFCTVLDRLADEGFIAEREVGLPPLYLACGQWYVAGDNGAAALDMLATLVDAYPQHPLVAGVDDLLLGSPIFCDRLDELQASSLAGRPRLIASLCYACGQMYEDDKDWTQAIGMYERFLADYPDDPRAPDGEASLIRSIIAQADAAGASELSPPWISDLVDAGHVVLVIQNDSPEQVQIVLSGPVSRIEVLGPCSSCQAHVLIPLFCEAKGPIGRYTLPPGNYDVVVRSTSGSAPTWGRGTWALSDGMEYSGCFFIMQQFGFDIP